MAATQIAPVPTSDDILDEKLASVYEDGVSIPLLSNDEKRASLPVTPLLGPKKVSKGGKSKGKGKTKSKDEGVATVICAWIVKHQLGLAVNLILLLFLTHLMVPRARRHTRKFFELSYYRPETNRYSLGWNDINMVVFYIIVFTGLRAGVMDHVLAPIARYAGVRGRKQVVRFSEQAWILLYDTTSWSFGMYILLQYDYWYDFEKLWAGWPHRELDGFFKWYYLVQFAFWIQQIVVVNIEERRKDHLQMFSHHIVTCSLIFASYGYHQTRAGNMILCLMDVVDLILPAAKMLKYTNHRKACDVAFGVFMVVWFISRHVIFVQVIWSLYSDLPKVVDLGCYYGKPGDLHGPFPAPNDYVHILEPFVDPQGLVCWTKNVSFVFISMLVALQILLIIWFGMIIKVAAKVLRGSAAEDSRSDDEDSDGGDINVPAKNDLLPSPNSENAVEEDSEADTERDAAPKAKPRRASGRTNGGNRKKELLGR